MLVSEAASAAFADDGSDDDDDNLAENCAITLEVCVCVCAWLHKFM